MPKAMQTSRLNFVVASGVVLSPEREGFIDFEILALTY